MYIYMYTDIYIRYMPAHTEYIYSLYVKSSLLYQHSGLRRNNTEGNAKQKHYCLIQLF